MTEAEFKKRTKDFALDVIHFTRSLPQDLATRHISHQLLRSATSVAANYRAACRAKSIPDMIAKLGIVEEEGDESLFWLELLSEIGHDTKDIEELQKSANELVAMTVSSIRTLRTKLAK